MFKNKYVLIEKELILLVLFYLDKRIYDIIKTMKIIDKKLYIS